MGNEVAPGGGDAGGREPSGSDRQDNCSPRQVPFDHAERYRAQGWTGTLPLPPRRKSPVPEGFTGYEGAWPSGADIAEWREHGYANHDAGNLALRLPPNVVGIDVDQYGEKVGGQTLAGLEASWGPLPATWISTSRDLPSGIRLFRVPVVEDWPSQAGPDIEIIRYGHRYTVVAPSVNPDSGNTYRWIRPDGTDAAPDEIPSPGELPELPAAWLEGLTGTRPDGSVDPEHVKPGSRAEHRERERQAWEWLRTLPGGEPCRYVGKLTADALAAARREDGSAYENTRDAVLPLLRAAETGHPGVPGQIRAVKPTYVAAVADKRPRSVAEGEFDRFTLGGAALVLSTPGAKAGQGCDCLKPLSDTTFTVSGDRQGQAPPEGVPGESAGEDPYRDTGTAGTPRTHWTLSGLMATEFSDPRWAVPGVIPEGVTLLVGPPKVGKSWLVLGTAISVARGDKALGRVPVQSGPVLYLALEDTPRRLKSRAGKLLQGHTAPEGLVLVTSCPSLPEGGDGNIRAWLDHHPDARMVILDVFARMRGPAPTGGSQYDADYLAVTRAKCIADDYGVAVVLVHHVRKQGSDDFLAEVSGTNGIAGAADAVLVLKRSRGEADAALHITGRDVDESESALKFHAETGAWELLDGPAVDHLVSPTAKTILDHLRTHPGARPKAIAEATGLDYETVRKTCPRMAERGHLRSEPGGHYYPVDGGDPDTGVPAVPLSLDGASPGETSGTPEDEPCPSVPPACMQCGQELLLVKPGRDTCARCSQANEAAA